ncbi:MAG: HlyD family secretion protein, partial [Caldilineaceae bacterium]
VTTASAQVTIAERQYSEAASHPLQSEIDAAGARVAMAQAGVEQAQAAYNLVRGDPEIGAMPQSQALRTATAALEAAQAEALMVTEGPTAEQLAVLSGQIDAAAAAVAAAESRLPGAEAAVASALARQASAQAALDALLAGADAEELAMAQAHVASAQAALASAEANLRQTQVVAPFAGVVGQINTRVGEMATPGQPLLLLGDVSALHVETTDLRETDVVRLALEMPVEVSFDALPDRQFVGHIVRIAPVSNTDKGSTNFTVHVDVDELDPSLRWGMTAFVNINPDE